MVNEVELINEIVQMAVEGHLGPVRVSLQPIPPEVRADVSAHIRIEGGWDGEVILSCSTRFARCAASQMFATRPERLSEEEVTDALGELVNMIAGNFKAVLDKRCSLSFPQVRWDKAETPPLGRCVSRAAFVSEVDDIPIVVGVFRHSFDDTTTGTEK